MATFFDFLKKYSSSLWRLEVFREKGPRKKLFVGLFLGLAFLASYFYRWRPDGQLHMHFLDVGQGDSILITTPRGSNVLVDGGPDSSVLRELSSKVPIHRRNFELVAVTHPHADHITGIIEVIKRYDIKYILLNKGLEFESDPYLELKREVENYHISTLSAYSGDFFTIDGVEFKVCWPEDKGNMNLYGSDNLNDSSLVLLVIYKNFEVLLTGDLEAESQTKVHCKQEVEVMKAPHQGAKDSLNLEFLQAFSPDIVIISVGKNNFGHPSPQVLGSYKERGLPYVRTDLHGTVSLVSDGRGWGVETEKTP